MIDVHEGLQHLAGEMNGLDAFIIAVIATHPNPVALRQMYESVSEEQVARSLPINVGDTFLAGQQAMRERISANLAADAKRREALKPSQ